jgi:hypothetical protein
VLHAFASRSVLALCSYSGVLSNAAHGSTFKLLSTGYLVSRDGRVATRCLPALDDAIKGTVSRINHFGWTDAPALPVGFSTQGASFNLPKFGRVRIGGIRPDEQEKRRGGQ